MNHARASRQVPISSKSHVTIKMVAQLEFAMVPSPRGLGFKSRQMKEFMDVKCMGLTVDPPSPLIEVYGIDC